MDIYSFTIRGLQIDMTFKKGYVAFTFEKDGQTYGQKIKLKNRSIMEAVTAATLLVINAYESIDALQK